MTPKPKQSSRYRQLLRGEKSLLKLVPIIEKAHKITRQHKSKAEK